MRRGQGRNAHAPARRERRRTCRPDPRPPLSRHRGGNGEWDADIPLLPGDHVTEDAGTGFVHTAPSHGDDDYRTGRETRAGDDLQRRAGRQLSRRPAGVRRSAIILPDGKEGPANVSNIKALHGPARCWPSGKLKHSLSALLAVQGAGHLSQHAAVVRRHRQALARRHGHLWRNDPRARADLDRRAGGMDPADAGATACFSMVEHRPDWVLSRQRAWGVPLTCFVRRGAQADADDFLLRDPTVNTRITQAFETDGADVWFTPGFKDAYPGGHREPRRLRPGDRHAGRVVRQRLDPCLRAARPAGRRA